MAPKLYTMAMNVPTQSVLLTAKALDLELEIIVLDPTKGDHLDPTFLKINPERAVPTLDDDGFILWDNHAINKYLVLKHGKDDSLYPKNLQQQIIVDQCLFYNCNVLQTRMNDIVNPIIRDGAKKVSKEKMDQLVQGYSSLENALRGKKYAAGNDMTIADLDLVVTISSAATLVPIAANRFPKIIEWLSRMQALPYYQEINQVRVDIFAAFIKSKMS